MTNYDICIVGGGMVGLAMAASLAETELNILLIEKQDLNQSLNDHWLLNQKVEMKEFDVRVSAISPVNRDFLKQHNVWQNIPQQRLAHYQKMNVWDGDGTGKIEFDAAAIAQADLGVIVENRVLQAALLKRINNADNIHCYFGVGLEDVEINDEAVSIVLSDGSSAICQLIIGADGAHSNLRKKLSIQSNETDYQQIAYVMNVKTEHSHQHTAWQRFTATGPVAFLPLPDEHCCSVVWSIDQDKGDALASLNSKDFALKLQYAFESRLGNVAPISQHFAFPLVKRHAQSYLSKRAALVGDAAHTIHPLAGQGVNLGFQDVDNLSTLIIKLIDAKRDFSLLQNLRSYERERKTKNLIMQNAMSAFKHIFANQSLPITLLRNFTMSGLNRFSSAKDIIIKKAIGL